MPFYGGTRRVLFSSPTSIIRISAVVATQVTESSVTVTWTTNIPSTSRLDYGSVSPNIVGTENTSLVTSHSVSVTGINPLSAWSQSFSYIPRSRRVAGVGAYTSGLPGFIGLEYFLPRVGPFAALAAKKSSSVGSETTDEGVFQKTRLAPYEYNDVQINYAYADPTNGYPSLYFRTNILRTILDTFFDATGLNGLDALNETRAGDGGRGFNGGGGGASATGAGASPSGGGGGTYSLGPTLNGSDGENINFDGFIPAGGGAIGDGLTVDAYTGYAIHPGDAGYGGNAESFDAGESGLGGGGGSSGGRIVIASNQFIGDPLMGTLSVIGGDFGYGAAVDNGAGSYGNNGQPGGAGTVHCYFRQYDGTLATKLPGDFELWEIGSDGITLTRHLNAADTWNNL